MKLAAISPRTISFNQRTSERPVTGTPLHRAPQRIPAESRDTRPLHLTPREREVLALLCHGYSNKLISRELGISAGTVKIHVGKVLAELGVASRLQAVVAAHRHGLVQDSSTCDDEAAFDRRPLEQALTGSAFQARGLRAA